LCFFDIADQVHSTASAGKMGDHDLCITVQN
jgi:hypothetical protein